MEFITIVMIVLNMVQVNKDAARCKKSDFKEAGCSVYVKVNLDKK